MTSTVQRIFPTTTWGKWSLGAGILMPLLFALGFALANTVYRAMAGGDTIVADIAARPALALTMLTGMTAGVLALIAGLVALIRRQERAMLVYVSTAVGALVVVYLIGEFAAPH